MSWELLFDRVVPALLLAQLALILWNRSVVRRPPVTAWDRSAPLVSVLVPARNEEETISGCLAGLLAQDYPNLEVIILDDGSTDATASIARAVADPRIRLIAGQPLPARWTGKNWACHQLSQAAIGDLLCFVDADTLLEPEAISAAAGALAEEGAGLVSLLPRSGQGSRAGQVLLPMVTHATFALFPVASIHSTRHPALAAAFGPFILVTRDAYLASGGHAAHPGSIIDDVQLSRSVKETGRRVRLFDGTDLVQTSWYWKVGDIWTGFAKNSYATLGYNPWVASAVILVLAPLLLSPVVRVALGALEGDISALAVWQLLLLMANRALTSVFGRDPLWSTPLHPITLAFWASTLAWSVVLATTEREVVWKGRALSIGAEDPVE
jgi:glycosyltransferase involved in cell wall biosynthesis